MISRLLAGTAPAGVSGPPGPGRRARAIPALDPDLSGSTTRTSEQEAGVVNMVKCI